VIGRRAWNQGKIDVVNETLVDDFILHGPTAPERRSRDDYKQWIVESRMAFPDLQITIDDEVVDGEQIVTRWTVRGTQQRDLVQPIGTIPATQREIKVTEITIARYANGKLVEDWQESDTLGFRMQLGVLPTPASEKMI
jgi:predicted ester cyclase